MFEIIKRFWVDQKARGREKWLIIVTMILNFTNLFSEKYMNEDRVFICRFAMRPCLIVSSNILGRDKPIMGFSMSCFQCDKIRKFAAEMSGALVHF